MPKSSDWVISELERAGWYLVHQKGSHRHYKHAIKHGKITVPYPRKDLALGTLKDIERKSGLKLR